MKFLGFSKIWRQDSKIYFSKKKKNFEMKYILRISSPDFGEKTRFHFHFPLCFGRMFFIFSKVFQKFFPFSEKSPFFKKIYFFI